jgi:hypothetical protein
MHVLEADCSNRKVGSAMNLGRSAHSGLGAIAIIQVNLLTLELTEPQVSREQPVLPDISKKRRVIGIRLCHVPLGEPRKDMLIHVVEAVVECEIHTIDLDPGRVRSRGMITQRDNGGRIPEPDGGQ